MPEIKWLETHFTDETSDPPEQVANLDEIDYRIFLEEIEHR